MLSMNELKLGKVIELDGQPYQIIFTQHIKVARGGAVLKTKLKNLINGLISKTYVIIIQLKKTF
jgi:elongation factor P